MATEMTVAPRREHDDRVVARVPAATAEAMRQAARRNHRTLGGELRAAIAEHLPCEDEALSR
jgi:hypothetical protein